MVELWQTIYAAFERCDFHVYMFYQVVYRKQIIV